MHPRYRTSILDRARQLLISSLTCLVVLAACVLTESSPIGPTTDEGGGGTARCLGPGGQVYNPATQHCCGTVAVPLGTNCCTLMPL